MAAYSSQRGKDLIIWHKLPTFQLKTPRIIPHVIILVFTFLICDIACQ